MAWEHKDHVELLVAMVGQVVLWQEKCHKCRHHLRTGCVMNLRVGSGHPNNCTRVV